MIKNMTQSQQLTIKQALSRAKKAAKKGKIAIAVELYTAVLAIQPKHPVAKKALYTLQKGSPDNKTILRVLFLALISALVPHFQKSMFKISGKARSVKQWRSQYL